ncbi:MAG: hypothetical protein JW928_09550, partial [Candidatus Aureabacteria bacterium]|nr:hypothetical protein [Candidatus Auribacterota bacterium]
MNKKKIFVSTLGCPKNLVDTEIFCGNLARNGFRLVDDLSLADVAIVNTCSFIKEAREETYREIQDLCRYKEHHHRGLCLIITGCLLKNRSVSLLKKRFPCADAFVSPEEYVRFAEILGLVTRQAGKKMKRGARVFSKGKSVFQSFRPEEYR